MSRPPRLCPINMRGRWGSLHKSGDLRTKFYKLKPTCLASLPLKRSRNSLPASKNVPWLSENIRESYSYRNILASSNVSGKSSRSQSLPLGSSGSGFVHVPQACSFTGVPLGLSPCTATILGSWGECLCRSCGKGREAYSIFGDCPPEARFRRDG